MVPYVFEEQTAVVCMGVWPGNMRSTTNKGRSESYSWTTSMVRTERSETTSSGLEVHAIDSIVFRVASLKLWCLVDSALDWRIVHVLAERRNVLVAAGVALVAGPELSHRGGVTVRVPGAELSSECASSIH